MVTKPTNKPTGRPPKPTETKRRLGNPGKRPLPDPATVIALPSAVTPPEPSRPLAAVGQALWDRVWSAGALWLARHVDAEAVLCLCERMDERAALRLKVFQHGDWRERAALRALDAQISGDLSSLGFTPVDRARLGVAEVKPATKLEQLMARKNGG